MAASVVTATITAHYSVGKWQFVFGTVAVAAGDYVADGNTITIDSLTAIKSSSEPVFHIVAGNAGYHYAFVPTSGMSGKLKICSTADTQVVAGAMPAGVVETQFCSWQYFHCYTRRLYGPG